jgi:hypothetical protein
MTRSVPERARLEEALRRCAAGDPAALRFIYDAEAPRMLGVAMRLLRRRSLAEEAVHDTFLQVWQHASSFDAAKGNVTRPGAALFMGAPARSQQPCQNGCAISHNTPSEKPLSRRREPT